MKKVVIIGSGISSLSSACYLAKAGFDVTVIEKNNQLGGRISLWESEGFKFDKGPSWYWMPDVYESFFGEFGFKVEDFYDLKKLDPGFRMIYNVNDNDYIDLKADIREVYKLFYEEEKLFDNADGSKNLKSLLDDGKYTYDNALGEYMNKISSSVLEFVDPYLIKSFIKGGLLMSYGKKIEEKFKNPKIRKLLDFPVLFLGATSKNTPYLYNLMAYSMIEGGTYYPMGGMVKISESFIKLGNHLGVKYITNAEVKEVELNGSRINKVIVYDKELKNHKSDFEFASQEHKEKKLQQEREKQYLNSFHDIDGVELIKLTDLEDQNSLTGIYQIEADFVVNGGDYHHFEQNILPKKFRMYDDKYWDSQILSPSSLIAYVGLDKQIDNLEHHNLFFEPDLEKHGEEIYTTKIWPTDPLFYVCCPSKTDSSVAPEGCENLFFLMPLTPGLDDNAQVREEYFEIMIKRLSLFCNLNNLKNNIKVKRLYCVKDFESDYFSFKGNAYGHANTLKQTAIFKPKMVNKKLKNLVNCGQLTVPGPGIPPCIISGRIAADYIIKLNK